MLRFVIYFFNIYFINRIWVFILNNFENKRANFYKISTRDKTTSLFIQENLKKYLQTKDIEILNTINSVLMTTFHQYLFKKLFFQ